MTDFDLQPLAWVVKPKGGTVDCESSTTIARTHEGDGQFLEISKKAVSIALRIAGHSSCVIWIFPPNCEIIQITQEEWPKIRSAIETAFLEILADELHEFKGRLP